MKKFLLLVGVLAVLALAWWALGRRETAMQVADVPEVATHVDTLTVNKMVLTRLNEPTLVFTKDVGGFWNMVEPVTDRASSNILEQMERGLATMKFVNKISDRESQLAAFQIDDVQGSRLQAYADSTLQADLYLGKLTPDRQHVYARPFGTNTVYSATGGGALSALRTRDIDSFRNHEMLNYEPASFDSLEIKTAAFAYHLARVDSASWSVRTGTAAAQPANAAIVDGFLRALGKMRASGFRADSVAVDWSHSDISISAWLLGEPELKVDMQKSKGDEYWVRLSGRPHDFAVFESVFKTFDKDPKDFVLAPKSAPKQGS